MNEGDIHEGGCLCGAVRYRATGRPVRVNYCHCRMCLKATGAPVSAWATFARSQVRFVQGRPTLRRSSDIARHGFCATCGSALTWEGDGDPDLTDVSIGSLDHPEKVAPQEHLWTESAVRWLHIDDELPRHHRSRSEGAGD